MLKCDEYFSYQLAIQNSFFLQKHESSKVYTQLNELFYINVNLNFTATVKCVQQAMLKGKATCSVMLWLPSVLKLSYVLKNLLHTSRLQRSVWKLSEPHFSFLIIGLSFYHRGLLRTKWFSLFLKILAQCHIIFGSNELLLKVNCAWNVVSQILDFDVKRAAL
jgi:hypothetical protein